MKTLLPVPLRFTPGEKWVYSNSGYYGTSHPYGLGWELDPPDGQHQRVHHGGSLAGFHSEFSRFLDTRLSVIILMNLDGVDYNLAHQGSLQAGGDGSRGRTSFLDKRRTGDRRHAD